MSEFQRQHPAAAITRLVTVIRQNLITFVLVLFFGLRGSDNEYTMLIFLAALLFALIYGILSWWQYRFRVTDGELHIEYGVFVRQKLYLNRERIQVIDITEGLIQRMFGLVKMDIKTAGSGTEKASISALDRNDALEIQRLLRKNDAEDVLPSSPSESIDAKPEVITKKLPFKELILAALTSGSIGIIASIIGAVSSQLDQFINEETLAYVYDVLPGFSNIFLISIIVITLLVISWILSFLGVIFQDAEFSIEKNERELKITKGLFERKHATIPLNRIQAVRFVEGPIRLPFNLGMLYVESAGFEQDKSRSVVLYPLIRKQDVADFLADFLPEFQFQEITTKPSESSFYRYLRRPNYILIPAVLLAAVLLSKIMLWFLLLVIPATYLAWRSFEESGVATGEEDLLIRERFFSRITTLLKRNRVQAADISQNPFQFRKNLSDYSITVASGRGGMQFTLRDADTKEARKLLNWVKPLSETKKETSHMETSVHPGSEN